MSDTILVGRFVLNFVYSIDMGFVCGRLNETCHDIYELQANRALNDDIMRLFGEGATLGPFRGSRIERHEFANIEEQMLRNGGKQIFSSLFLSRYLPICFDRDNSALTPSFGIAAGDTLENLADLGEGGVDIRYEGCSLRLFTDGALSLVFRFARTQAVHSLSVSQVIGLLRTLQAHTLDGYDLRMNAVIRDLSHRELLKGIGLKPFDYIDEKWAAVINGSTAQHSCIFIERVFDASRPEINVLTDATVELERFIASFIGILNKSTWYDKYGPKTIQRLHENFLQHRSDEFYVTVNSATAVLLADYWKPNDPLQQYRHFVLLGIEFLVAKLAHSIFLAEHFQANKELQALLGHATHDVDIGAILKAREIMWTMHEDLNLRALISHTFTMEFMAQLINELGLPERIRVLEKIIENIDEAVKLKTTVSLWESASRETKRVSVASAILGAAAIGLAAVQLIGDAEARFLLTHVFNVSFPPSGGWHSIFLRLGIVASISVVMYVVVYIFMSGKYINKKSSRSKSQVRFK